MLYVWNCKISLDRKKHRSNARVIPVVPIEIQQNEGTAISYDEWSKKFKSTCVPGNVPAVMAIAKDNFSVSSPFTPMEVSSGVFADRVEDLKSDAVLNYTLNRVLHLTDVLTSIEKKCTSRAFDILNFPFSDVKRMVQAFRGNVSSEDSDIDGKGLYAEMNRDCLRRHLSAFGLELDQVPGDGDCCFASIVKELHKLLANNDDGNEEFAGHLKSVGLGNSTERDTLQLRLLFCQEIEKNLEKYSSFMNFNVKDELKRFSESGWFNSSLADLCVYGCRNLLEIPVIVITSIPGSPVLTFVPSTLRSTRSIYIAYNHSSPGHYDGTKGELPFVFRTPKYLKSKKLSFLQRNFNTCYFENEQCEGRLRILRARGAVFKVRGRGWGTARAFSSEGRGLTLKIIKTHIIPLNS